MGRIVLVTGGARSGKSQFGEKVVARYGPKVAFYATGRLAGREMIARVARHAARRLPTWTHMRESFDLAAGFSRLAPDADAVLFECLQTWVANRVLSVRDDDTGDFLEKSEALEAEVLQELQAFLALVAAAPWPIVFMTGEVGQGLSPEKPRQRLFRDLVGRANEVVATASSHVFLVVAGQGIDIKRLAFDPATSLEG